MKTTTVTRIVALGLILSLAVPPSVHSARPEPFDTTTVHPELVEGERLSTQDRPVEGGAVDTLRAQAGLESQTQEELTQKLQPATGLEATAAPVILVPMTGFPKFRRALFAPVLDSLTEPFTEDLYMAYIRFLRKEQQVPSERKLVAAVLPGLREATSMQVRTEQVEVPLQIVQRVTANTPIPLMTLPDTLQKEDEEEERSAFTNLATAYQAWRIRVAQEGLSSSREIPVPEGWGWKQLLELVTESKFPEGVGNERRFNKIVRTIRDAAGAAEQPVVLVQDQGYQEIKLPSLAPIVERLPDGNQRYLQILHGYVQHLNRAKGVPPTLETLSEAASVPPELLSELLPVVRTAVREAGIPLLVLPKGELSADAAALLAAYVSGRLQAREEVFWQDEFVIPRGLGFVRLRAVVGSERPLFEALFTQEPRIRFWLEGVEKAVAAEAVIQEGPRLAAGERELLTAYLAEVKHPVMRNLPRKKKVATALEVTTAVLDKRMNALRGRFGEDRAKVIFPFRTVSPPAMQVIAQEWLDVYLLDPENMDRPGGEIKASAEEIARMDAALSRIIVAEDSAETMKRLAKELKITAGAAARHLQAASRLLEYVGFPSAESTLLSSMQRPPSEAFFQTASADVGLEEIVSVPGTVQVPLERFVLTNKGRQQGTINPVRDILELFSGKVVVGTSGSMVYAPEEAEDADLVLYVDEAQFGGGESFDEEAKRRMVESIQAFYGNEGSPMNLAQSETGRHSIYGIIQHGAGAENPLKIDLWIVPIGQIPQTPLLEEKFVTGGFNPLFPHFGQKDSQALARFERVTKGLSNPLLNDWLRQWYVDLRKKTVLLLLDSVIVPVLRLISLSFDEISPPSTRTSIASNASALAYALGREDLARDFKQGKGKLRRLLWALPHRPNFLPRLAQIRPDATGLEEIVSVKGAVQAEVDQFTIPESRLGVPGINFIREILSAAPGAIVGVTGSALIDPERMEDLDLVVYYEPSSEENFEREAQVLVSSVEAEINLLQFRHQNLRVGFQEPDFAKHEGNFRTFLVMLDPADKTKELSRFRIDILVRNPKYAAGDRIVNGGGGFNPFTPYFALSGGGRRPLERFQAFVISEYPEATIAGHVSDWYDALISEASERPRTGKSWRRLAMAAYASDRMGWARELMAERGDFNGRLAELRQPPDFRTRIRRIRAETSGLEEKPELVPQRLWDRFAELYGNDLPTVIKLQGDFETVSAQLNRRMNEIEPVSGQGTPWAAVEVQVEYPEDEEVIHTIVIDELAHIQVSAGDIAESVVRIEDHEFTLSWIELRQHEMVNFYLISMGRNFVDELRGEGYGLEVLNPWAQRLRETVPDFSIITVTYSRTVEEWFDQTFEGRRPSRDEVEYVWNNRLLPSEMLGRFRVGRIPSSGLEELVTPAVEAQLSAQGFAGLEDGSMLLDPAELTFSPARVFLHSGLEEPKGLRDIAAIIEMKADSTVEAIEFFEEEGVGSRDVVFANLRILSPEEISAARPVSLPGVVGLPEGMPLTRTEAMALAALSQRVGPVYIVGVTRFVTWAGKTLLLLQFA